MPVESPLVDGQSRSYTLRAGAHAQKIPCPSPLWGRASTSANSFVQLSGATTQKWQEARGKSGFFREITGWSGFTGAPALTLERGVFC